MKIIEIANLKFTYPDGTVALKGINLDIEEGESVAIVGPNGSGKSTLLLQLNGILRGEGTIRIRSLLLEEKNLRRIRSLVGMVFQDPDDQLFSPTVFDDVAFGPMNMGLSQEEVRRKVKEALEEVELTGFGHRSAHHLSFGEKKKVSIATILSTNPKILALDEPTSNLDPRARRHIIDLLKGLKQTKIVATHDMNLAWELCERAVILNDGKIAADGSREKILTNEPLLVKHGLELPSLSTASKR